MIDKELKRCPHNNIKEGCAFCQLELQPKIKPSKWENGRPIPSWVERAREMIESYVEYNGMLNGVTTAYVDGKIKGLKELLKAEGYEVSDDTA